jgi:hypothetical protein
MALSADWMRPSCALLSLPHYGAQGNARTTMQGRRRFDPLVNITFRAA